MIDIHCHILPGVDDGAGTLAEALEMAQMAAAGGVEAIIATPHCSLPYMDDDNFRSPELLEHFRALDQAVRTAGIPLRIYPGAEVFCTPELEDQLAARQLLTLAGSRYLLMEFFFDESLDFMEWAMETVAGHGLIPVLAHPERYVALQRQPYAAQRWFAAGAVIQVNKGSIMGRFGAGPQETADLLLQWGIVHTVASDAHSPRMRTTDLAQIRRVLERDYHPEYARVLLDINPRRILENQPMLEV